jgi:CBS domain containing-hemolysin-like protein
MDVENAANILAGSILTMLSLIIIVIGIVVINNIFAKYWKPIQWMKMLTHPMYVTREEIADHKEPK